MAMLHKKDEETIKYINKYITPQGIKISRMIIKNQTDKEGMVRVYIRLRRYNPATKKDEQTKKIPTDVTVKPKYWSAKKGEVLVGDLFYKEKNRKIREKESQISTYIHNPDADYMFAQLRREEFVAIEKIFPSKRSILYFKSLADYISDYYERRKRLGHPKNTIKEFQTVMNRVKIFDDKHMGKKTDLIDINLTWSDEFEIWLNKQNYAPGTIEKTYTILLTVLNYYWEVKDELKIKMIDKFKSKNFKRGKKSRNKPNPLTKDQLDVLYNHRFTAAHFERVRKMVLIQCYTGIRFGDLSKIRPENITNDYLLYTPQKTEKHQVQVEQPLNYYCKKLLAEVNYDTSCYSMQNQPYNRAIKEMFKLLANEETYKELKFKTNYTSHNFRDTFISIAVSSGVNWKSILRWVGQSSYAIMDRYIDLSRPFEVSEMEKLFSTPKSAE